jgi:YbgC/YbaW family acyl-CoA thioester hydrolase
MTSEPIPTPRATATSPAAPCGDASESLLSGGVICRTKIKVHSYHLDSFGHVNNAVYLQFLEAARCEILERFGLRFEEFERRGEFPVLVRAELDFRAPARCHDLLIIETSVVEWRSRAFTMGYRVLNGEGGPLVLEARTVHLFIDRAGKVIAIPEWFKPPLISRDLDARQPDAHQIGEIAAKSDEGMPARHVEER